MSYVASINKIVEKWACCHEWELHQKMSTYDGDSSNRPWKVEETLSAKNVVKLKKLNFNETIHNTRADRQADRAGV